MFIKLIFLALFIFIRPAFSQTIPSEKLKELAFSNSWLNLYYYNKGLTGYSSNALGDHFFFSKEGRDSPEKEIEAAYRAFLDNQKMWGQVKKISQCAFPARYEFLKKHFPQDFKDKKCPEFDNWSKAIDAEKIYLVYAGAYPNNPASMFGHTFIRFSRGDEKEKREGSFLLNYSIGYMAVTNPADDAITYTLKGIVGGYHGYFEIKPFYLNLGIYNNSEARDLWEYEVSLNKKEVSYLLKHIWELSQNSGFPYYFFKKNCSYYMLRLIEVVKPDWRMHQDYWFFTSPLQTITSLKKYDDNQKVGFHPSIKRKLTWKLNQLDQKQLEKYRQSLASLESLGKVDDPKVLETLITHWDLQNYKKNTLLSKDELKLRNLTLEKRSLHDSKAGFYYKEKDNNWITQTSGAPDKGHPPHRIALSYENYSKNINFEIAYGFHRFLDKPEGYEDYAFIDAMKIKGSYLTDQSKLKLIEAGILEIYSLFPFSKDMPALSWNLSIDWSQKNLIRNESLSTFNILGGIGLSQKAFKGIFQHFILINPIFTASFSKEKYNLALSLNYGLKLMNSFTLGATMLHLNNHFKMKTEGQYRFYINKYHSLFLSYKKYLNLKFNQELSLGYQLNF